MQTTKKNGKRARIFATVNVGTDNPVLRRADMKRVHHVVKTSRAVEVYVASVGYVTQWLSTLFGEGTFALFF